MQLNAMNAAEISILLILHADIHAYHEMLNFLYDLKNGFQCGTLVSFSFM